MVGQRALLGVAADAYMADAYIYIYIYIMHLRIQSDINKSAYINTGNNRRDPSRVEKHHNCARSSRHCTG